ncbi:MAG: radical SAM protein [Deltaproteobacteria bacterium]|nr:radical SAM protein [Deltaproteobacteria bacterium]
MHSESDVVGWRDRGGVVLVSCYELGHQPLAIASVVPHFIEAGFQPVCVDVSTERFDPAAVSRARFVAISVPMHTALRIGVRVAEEVRRVNGSAQIAFFGLYAALNHEFLLGRYGDACLGGETDGPLVALAKRLEAGESHEQLGAMSKVHLERPRFFLPVRDGLPPLRRYARLEKGGQQILAGAVEASRGCLHRCRHCPITPIYNGRFFVVPEEIVLSDIAALVARGAGHITFADPDFLNGPTHAVRIARVLHARWPALSFDFTAKVEHLLRHAVLATEFAALGCAFVVTAVESFSDVVLENLKKGHTRDGAIAALRMVRQAGISVHPSFVPFTPWTTRGDYVTMLDLLEAEDLVDSVDPIQLAIRLLVPPRSALLSEPVMTSYLGPVDRENFVVPWRHPDPSMDTLQSEVVAMVADAVARGEAPATTFRAVKRLASAGSDRTLDFVPHREPPPRLTEPWFC